MASGNCCEHHADSVLGKFSNSHWKTVQSNRGVENHNDGKLVLWVLLLSIMHLLTPFLRFPSSKLNKLLTFLGCVLFDKL